MAILPGFPDTHPQPSAPCLALFWVSHNIFTFLAAKPLSGPLQVLKMAPPLFPHLPGNRGYRYKRLDQCSMGANESAGRLQSSQWARRRGQEGGP